MYLTASRNIENQFVLLFSEEENCRHKKHVAKLSDYLFVFCSDSKKPLSIYCGKEVVDSEDVMELVMQLAEKYTFLNGVIESPYFTALGDALLNELELDIK